VRAPGDERRDVGEFSRFEKRVEHIPAGPVDGKQEDLVPVSIREPGHIRILRPPDLRLEIDFPRQERGDEPDRRQKCGDKKEQAEEKHPASAAGDAHGAMPLYMRGPSGPITGGPSADGAFNTLRKRLR